MLAIERPKRRLPEVKLTPVSLKAQVGWLTLLVTAQMSDVLTTSFGLHHGTVEGNAVVASALHLGGITLFWILKVIVALAMAVAVVLVRRFASLYPSPRAVMMQQLAFRGTQIGAIALMLVTLNNLLVTGLLPLRVA